MFPCDTRLEAFPPYLSRVSSLTRLLFLPGGKGGDFRLMPPLPPVGLGIVGALRVRVSFRSRVLNDHWLVSDVQSFFWTPVAVGEGAFGRVLVTLRLSLSVDAHRLTPPFDPIGFGPTTDHSSCDYPVIFCRF